MSDTAESHKVYTVKGMTCNHCVANVKKHLSEAELVNDVQVDLSSGRVMLQGNIEDKKVKSIVEDIGYEYAGKAE